MTIVALSDSVGVYQTIAKFKQAHPVRRETTDERNLEFSHWIRAHGRPSKRGCRLGAIDLGGYVSTDLDFILYDYINHKLMLLEVKTRGGNTSFSQSDTLTLIDALLKLGAGIHGKVDYRGLHVLRMQGTTPTNSEWIEWDGMRIDKQTCWRRLNMLDALEISAPPPQPPPPQSLIDTVSDLDEVPAA